MNDYSNFPVALIYGALAVAGGCARYLTGYVDGKRFKLTIFLASAFISGFSGYMFALLGQSMSMPSPMLFMMAGVGGFMGEQSMKLIIDWITAKMKV